MIKLYDLQDPNIIVMNIDVDVSTYPPRISSSPATSYDRFTHAVRQQLKDIVSNRAMRATRGHWKEAEQ